MSEVQQVVARALHDTRDGGTAVLGADSGAHGIVQWISFGADGYVIEVPDPALHRPGRLRRLLGRSAPAAPGLGDEQVRALEHLGFAPGEHGYELHVGPAELGHDQLVHVITQALGAVGLDGGPVSSEVF